MIQKKHILPCAIAIALAAIVSSCADTQQQVADVAPLYSIFYDISMSDSPTAHTELTDKYSSETEAFFEITGSYGHDSITVDSWANSDVVKVFSPDVLKLYPTPVIIGETVAFMTDAATRNNLSIPAYKYAAVIWGNGKSIVFNNNIAMIALNHYLGADYPGYAGLPAYRAARKTSEMLPYDITEAVVATAYPFVAAAQPTALSRMLYEGAIAEAKIRLTPDATEAGALGYDRIAFDYLNKNESSIWQTLATRNLLYDINDMTASRLVDDLPATNIISQETPGRAGRFIGHRIISSYLKRHPDTTLAMLLSPDFYNSPDVLLDSGYAPN